MKRLFPALLIVLCFAHYTEAQTDVPTLSKREFVQVMDGVIEPPKVIKAVAPSYPNIARSAHAQGEVVIETEIDAEGEVTATKRIRGNGILAFSCAKAARSWLFEPGEPGRKVSLTFVFTVWSSEGVTTQVTFLPPYKVQIDVIDPPAPVVAAPEPEVNKIGQS